MYTAGTIIIVLSYCNVNRYTDNLPVKSRKVFSERAKRNDPWCFTSSLWIIKGHFSELLVSNIYWLTSLSADSLEQLPLTKFECFRFHSRFCCFGGYRIRRFWKRPCPVYVFWTGSFTCTLVSPLCVYIIAPFFPFYKTEHCTKCIGFFRATCRMCASLPFFDWQCFHNMVCLIR